MWLIKTFDNRYIFQKGISTENIENAKQFKTKENATQFAEEIRNMAEWMKDWRYKVVELKSEKGEGNG